jgi:hypothetical protein
MRPVSIVILGLILIAALTDCSKDNHDVLGVRGAGNLIEGTGTIFLNAMSVNCSTVNACSCPKISVDGGWWIAATNLEAGFATESMHVRFRVKPVGQTACGPGFDIPDTIVVIGVVSEMEPI